MEEETRKKLEKQVASIAESMKPSPALQKAMEEMNRTMAKIPKFEMPSITRPELTIPRMPPTQQEINNYQSASVLMKALAEEALQWKESLSENYRPAILAVLYSGIQIHVNSLSQVSFHGIRVEGTMNGAPCSLLAHQSTIQLLCYAEKVTAENPRNPIGFVWDDNRIEV
ncbi:MAG: hypothetical protein AB2724_11755 [Candidatus Thiodiazotropha sp.]